MSNTLKHDSTLIETATHYFYQGDLQESLKYCEVILQVNSQDINALNLAGIITDQLQQKSKAATYFRKAVNLNPNSPELLTNLASTLMGLGELDEAKKLLSKAIIIAPHFAEAFYNLGNIYILYDDHDAAIKAFIDTVKAAPNHYKALNNLAATYKKLNKLEDAKDSYLKALRINGQFLQSVVGLAALYFEQENYSEAEKLLIKAITLESGHNYACSLLTRIIRIGSSDPGKAIQCFKLALENNPGNLDYLNYLGEAYLFNNETENALRCFCESIKVDPDQLTICNYLARIYHEKRLYDLSIFYYEKAIEINPGNSKILDNYGHVLRETNQYGKAIEYYKKAIELDKLNPPDKKSKAINSLGLIELLTLDFKNGWDNYRSRTNIIESDIGVCPDRKKIELENKNVLFLRDQGIGDELFFLRFANKVRPFTLKSAYHCHSKLLPVLQPLNLFDEVIDEGCDHDSYDLCISIGDLPYILNHECSENIPPPVELKPNIEKKREIKEFLASYGPPPYIGITWRGGVLKGYRIDSYFKTIDKDDLCDVINNIQGTVIAIQVNAEKEELEYISKKLNRPVLDVSLYHEQLENMLCLLDIIDLYIGVSNTYVHMREGLAKKSHVLVNSPAEWRWLAEGKQSIWFPNSYAYRQSPDGSWEEAFSELASDLKRF